MKNIGYLGYELIQLVYQENKFSLVGDSSQLGQDSSYRLLPRQGQVQGLVFTMKIGEKGDLYSPFYVYLEVLASFKVFDQDYDNILEEDIEDLLGEYIMPNVRALIAEITGKSNNFPPYFIY